MKREVTIQEALTELAAAKVRLESMQQLLTLKEQLLSSKDDQINFCYEAALKEHKILYPKDKIVHVACAAHLRRKFYDALLNGKSKNSAIALKYIQKMYYEENRLREQNHSDSEFIKKQKEIIKPIMDEFYNWMTEIQPTVPETFKIWKSS